MSHSTSVTPSEGSNLAGTEEITSTVTVLGHRVLRYGLAVVIGWIGLMNFTGYEAQGIKPLILHSPLLGWMYHIWTAQKFSDGLGVVEVAIAILIALRAWSPKACVIGSPRCDADVSYNTVILFSTAGWEQSLGGFPALSAMPGQFLLKRLSFTGGRHMVTR